MSHPRKPIARHYRRTAATAMLALALLCAGPATQAAFQVEVYDSAGSITNMASATALMTGTPTASGTFATINFNDDYPPYDGHYAAGNTLFPGGLDDSFALRATTQLMIDVAGIYTIGMNSDDGALVRINGAQVLVDDSVHAPRTRLASINLGVGTHDLELLYFENHGAATIELFSAFGTYTSFSAPAFNLIGASVAGAVSTVPVPPSAALLLGAVLALRPKRAATR